MNQNIRILVVDDHPMVRKGLTATIEPEPDMQVVASAANGQQALERFARCSPTSPSWTSPSLPK